LLANIEYKNIEFLIVAAVAFLLWGLNYWKAFQKAQLIYPFKSSGKDQNGFDTLRGLLFALGSVSWLLMAISLVGPRIPLKFSSGNIEVNDIFFVLDVSRSMLVDDLKPNRLEVAKKKLREFVQLRPTDRIGVILFSEKVFTLLPLTTDTQVVDRVLKDVRIGFLGSGTNIGDGLALAVARATQSETKNKVIILLTDGVQNVGNMTPLQAAEVAKEYDIKVYTIGLGTDESARLPVGRGRHGKRYVSIPGGSIDMQTLDEISQMTGGKSYYAKSEESLKEILFDIEKLERTKIKSDNKVVYKELYYQYLLWGVILFFLVEMIRRFWIRELT
jgi:Ca-activated chloride channel homolog